MFWHVKVLVGGGVFQRGGGEGEVDRSYVVRVTDLSNHRKARTTALYAKQGSQLYARVCGLYCRYCLGFCVLCTVYEIIPIQFYRIGSTENVILWTFDLHGNQLIFKPNLGFKSNWFQENSFNISFKRFLKTRANIIC